MNRIEEAIAALHALNYAAVEHDPTATPEGFRIAQKLGLLDGSNSHITKLGRTVLMLLDMGKD